MQIILEVPDRLGKKLQQLGSRLPEDFDSHKSGTLSREESIELDRYLLLEHWVRSTKAHAYKYLQVTA